MNLRIGLSTGDFDDRYLCKVRNSLSPLSKLSFGADATMNTTNAISPNRGCTANRELIRPIDLIRSVSYLI